MKTAERIALVQLLRAYKSGEGLDYCPLCELHRDLIFKIFKIVNCTECIWSKYYSEYDSTGGHCLSWYEYIAEIRESPDRDTFGDLITERIAMIYKWLEEDL